MQGVQKQTGEMKDIRPVQMDSHQQMWLYVCVKEWRKKQTNCEMETVHSKELWLLMFFHMQNTHKHWYICANTFQTTAQQSQVLEHCREQTNGLTANKAIHQVKRHKQGLQSVTEFESRHRHPLFSMFQALNMQ